MSETNISKYGLNWLRYNGPIMWIYLFHLTIDLFHELYPNLKD